MLTVLGSCFEEEFVPGESMDVHFSVDTLRFDTVFTAIGSITRQVVIANRSSDNIFIKEINLAQPEGQYRLNVDGISGSSFSNIRINAEDSLYLFVEVTINPDDPLSISPFVLNGSIEVTFDNDQKEEVVLEAWGQNANYFPSRDAQGRLLRLSCNNSSLIWDDPKPYVVYGLLLIDSCELVITPGTQVYVHGGLARLGDQLLNDGGLLFQKDGSLDVIGTLEEPVVFQGDRLEPSFENVTGQWAGLRFLSESTNNRLSHAIIKNSIVGLRADSAAQLLIESSYIHNTSNVGLIGVNSEIKANNCLFYNNGAQSVLFGSGGSYELNYVTLANYINDRPAIYMDNFECLDADCEVVEVRPLEVTINNSIIYGSNENEVNIVDITDGAQPESINLSFNNTLIKIDEQENMFDFASICDACLINPEGELFVDENENLYKLDTMSIARDQGLPIQGLLQDILGVQRDAMTPDLGCFEFED